MVQLDKLRKGKRINHKFHISSGQVSRQFAVEQLCVGAGDVDVTVQLYPERVNAFFPGVHFLNLVKKEIDPAFHFRSTADNLIMKFSGSTEMSVAHIFKIDGDKLAAVHAGSQQFIFDQIQHD